MRSAGPCGLFLIAFLFLVSDSTFGQVFFENFEGEANNAVSGTAVGGTWTSTTPTGGVASFSRQNVGAPYGGIFRVENTGTEGVWRSSVLNISALGEVALEVLMGGIGTDANDYVRAYYVINGGPEVLFAEVLGQGALIVFTASSAVVSGNSLQIVIRGDDDSGGGGLMGFDDVRVTDISLLYSRASAAWNVGTTWSLTGFTGASCGCTPTDETRVIIGGGRNVSFTADGEAAGLEIQNTGTLTWLTNNNSDLIVRRGGTVVILNGGVLTRGSTTGSTLQFENYTYSINNAGSLTIGAMIFNGSGNSTLVNSNSLTLVTNPGLVINSGNGYTFSNSGTWTMTDMDLNSNDITFNNTGTVDHNGNFTDVDAGSTFNNQTNGTWNFSGTTITNVRLFANSGSNTFNYDGAAQNIITPQGAGNPYWNLSLSGSAAKTALASFAVLGNWSRSGTATFTPGAFTVSLTGSAAQAITATGGETFNNLTINNTFATSPQITLNNNVTVSGVLTMTDGNVNLNGTTLRLSSSAAGALSHTLVSTAGWLYGGTMTRAFAASTTIAIGNVRGAFPLGTSGTNWRPFFVGVNSNAGTVGNISVSHTDATTATTVVFPEGIVRRHDAFWSVSTTGLTGGTWLVRGGGTGYGPIQDNTDIRMSTATGVVGTHAAGSGGPEWRVNRTGLTFGNLTNNFHLASTDAVNSPLPVILSHFGARVEGEEVITQWKTAQEKNNHYFTVEKTIDFETFYEVGKVDGQGNSAEENAYSFIDESPFMGRSYYRLKQTDYNGEFSYSDPVLIDYSGPSFPFLKAFPNPSDGKKITLEVKGLKDTGAVTVSIYNQQGQIVSEILMEQEGPGVFKKEVIFADNLAPGLYIVKAGRTLRLMSKLVIN